MRCEPSVEAQIGQVVGNVAAFGIASADHHANGRTRMQNHVALDVEAADQVERLLACDSPGGEVCLVEGPQRLVEAAGSRQAVVFAEP